MAVVQDLSAAWCSERTRGVPSAHEDGGRAPDYLGGQRPRVGRKAAKRTRA